MKKIKIAIITNRFYPEVGGAETNIYYQAKKLAEYYEVTVICPKRIDQPSKESIEGFKIIRLFDLFNFPKKYPNLKAKTFCPGLFIHLLMNSYDIIQCFPSINYNTLLAWCVAKIKRIPIIFCFFDFVDYLHVIKTEGKIKKNYLNDFKLSFLRSYVLKTANAVFAISKKEINFLSRFNKNVIYSPVPVLPEEFQVQTDDPRENYGIQKKDFIFLCLGRISKIKGQDIALKAFAKALPYMEKAKLVIVGRADYEPDFFSSLQFFVEENRLKNSVVFTKEVSRTEVIGWLRCANIHVIPVRFMNSGAVVVESWIAGIPVIQSNVVDPNLVIEEENGFLFPSENIDALAFKMRKAYESREKLHEMGVKGRALVMKDYTYQSLISLYQNTYRQLLKLN